MGGGEAGGGSGDGEGGGGEGEGSGGEGEGGGRDSIKFQIWVVKWAFPCMHLHRFDAIGA